MKKLSKLLLALSFVLSVTTSAFAVTVVSWGGAYTESQKLGYGDPTAAKLGIPVNWVDYTGGLSEIKAQKEAGAITWDIMDVYAKDTIIGCDEGIFHEFDFDKDFSPAPDGTPARPSFSPNHVLEGIRDFNAGYYRSRNNNLDAKLSLEWDLEQIGVKGLKVKSYASLINNTFYIW